MSYQKRLGRLKTQAIHPEPGHGVTGPARVRIDAPLSDAIGVADLMHGAKSIASLHPGASWDHSPHDIPASRGPDPCRGMGLQDTGTEWMTEDMAHFFTELSGFAPHATKRCGTPRRARTRQVREAARYAD
jgi:hypothetical protein